VDVYAFDPWLAPFLDSLTQLCAGLSSAELTDVDRVLERRLYDIDREDIRALTDGSDDGFLYCRGPVRLQLMRYGSTSLDPLRHRLEDLGLDP
jgi:hypothetical protein